MHPFFEKELPGYIVTPARSIFTSDKIDVDDDIVVQVINLCGNNLGWSKSEIYRSLEYGEDLLMKSKALIQVDPSMKKISQDLSEDEWIQLRSMAIAYHILLDRKKHSSEVKKEEEDLWNIPYKFSYYFVLFILFGILHLILSFYR